MGDDAAPIDIVKPLYGGAGLGYANGKAVIVSLALPGDTVAAVITGEARDYRTASIKEIINPSPMRVAPPCPNFGSCGGCSYLNTDYPVELEIKWSVLEDSLRRIAGIKPADLPPRRVVSADRFHYRSLGDIKFSRGKPGFFMASSNRVVPFPAEGCRLLAAPVNRAAAEMDHGGGSFRIAMDYRGEIRQGVVRERENDLYYDRDIEDFFQVNRFLRGDMQRLVLEMSGISAGDRFVDIGCGIGFFTLYLARHSNYGQGVEINPRSVSWARKNARLNGVDNVSFLAMDARRLHPVKHRGDVVLMDPPRAGLSRATRKTIIAMEPRTCIYVSCNPATFSRDLRTFMDAGFSLERLVLLDMFPGTHHIELIAGLTGRSA